MAKLIGVLLFFGLLFLCVIFPPFFTVFIPFCIIWIFISAAGSGRRRMRERKIQDLQRQVLERQLAALDAAKYAQK